MKYQETKEYNLTELTERLKEATDNFAKVAEELSDARKRETYAINTLNRAQKEFDLCIEQIKRQAPSSSDWQRKAGKSEHSES